MRVRATKLGFDGLSRRRVGEEFEMPDDAKLGSWMEDVNPVPVAKEESKNDGKPAVKDAAKIKDKGTGVK